MSIKMSVIIPNLNSPTIDQTLLALINQEYDHKSYEVIIVGKDEPGLINQNDLITFDETDRPYSSAKARNRGAQQAKGSILVFLDADCIPTERWLSILDSVFDNNSIAAVGGGVKFYENQYWKLADNLSLFYEYLHTLPTGFRIQYPSLNFSIRKQLFISLGGFNEDYPLPAGEDFDFTLRVSENGNKIWFEPKAWVLHNPQRNSLVSLWKHAFIMGQFSTKIDKKFRGKVGLPTILRNRIILLILSPILAFVVTLKLFIKTPNSIRYLHTFPAILISKFGWCIGAVNSPLL